MKETSQPLKSLVLGVIHLCETTREMAESGTLDPYVVAAVRDAADYVQQELASLPQAWGVDELDAVPPAIPSEEPSSEWLFGEESAVEASEGWSSVQD